MLVYTSCLLNVNDPQKTQALLTDGQTDGRTCGRNHGQAYPLRDPRPKRYAQRTLIMYLLLLDA